MDNLEELAKQERRDYYKNWRAKNPDKVKKHNDNYWQRKAALRLGEATKERG